MTEVLIKRVTESSRLPLYASDGAAAADLYADCPGNTILSAGTRLTVGTGIAICLPSADYVGLIFARSGLASRQGISLANGVGVLDSDYRGELLIPLVNLSDETVIIEHGQRIAQLAIMPIIHACFTEVSHICETDRGEGGFGSTGKW